MRLITSFLTATLCLTQSLVWADPVADMIVITDPHTRAMPPGAPNSGTFFGLKNFDSKSHALVKAESLIAQRVELHTHIMEEGVARMREVERITVEAEDRTDLKPGGYHVMLLGLNQPIEPGTKVLITLTFDDGSQKTIVAPGRKIHGGGHHHHH